MHTTWTGKGGGVEKFLELAQVRHGGLGGFEALGSGKRERMILWDMMNGIFAP